MRDPSAFDDPDVMHLETKRKTGIQWLLFSRTGQMAILLLIELIFIIVAYIWLEESLGYIVVIENILAIAVIIYIFNSDINGSAKLTWTFLVMLFTIPATILLFYSNMDFGFRKLRDRSEAMVDESRGMIPQPEGVLNDPVLKNDNLVNLNTYINRAGTFPLYRDTEVTYFPVGEKKFEAMLTELEKAEHFIFLEYFIVEEGYMWGRILKILAEKAKQGVDVRFMYDGLCDISKLPHDYPKRVEKLGIRCRKFTPVRPFITTSYNYRDHRKILVIDGKVAFNGGVNLADEYINRTEPFGEHWKDCAVMLKGEAVRSFTLMFLQMWNMHEKTPAWEEVHAEIPTCEANGYVMPYCDTPMDPYKVGRDVYADILYRADRYVHIMTPYLILDSELDTALRFAAQRGVDVKLILPGVPDKKSANALAKTHYRTLIAAGVKIYEYSPGFLHSKVFVSDDDTAVVGTINLDYRSLYHHFECATYMYRTDCIPDIERDFQETLAKCRTVTPETIRSEKLSCKIRGTILKVLAPMM